MAKKINVGALNQDWILQQATTAEDGMGGKSITAWSVGTTYLCGAQTKQAKRKDENGREFTETFIELTTRAIDIAITEIQTYRWQDRSGINYKIQNIEDVNQNGWIKIFHLLPE